MSDQYDENARPASTAMTRIEQKPIPLGGVVKPVVPENIGDMARLANAIVDSGMAPKGMENPKTALGAIIMGAEVGFTAFMALKSIAVINGRPTIWGDGLVALVRRSGAAKYIMSGTDGEGDAMIGWARTWRVGDPEEQTATFSVADAKKASLWNKGGPWTQYPKRMLALRARSFLLRDVYADVLGGLYIREEVEDEDRSYQEPPPALEPPPATEPPAATEAVAPAAAGAADAEPARRRGRKPKDPAPVAETAAPADGEPAGEAVAAADGDDAPAPAHDPETGEIIEDAEATPVTDPPAASEAASMTDEELLAELADRFGEARSTDALGDLWDEFGPEITVRGRKFAEGPAAELYLKHERRIQTALVAQQARANATAPAANPPTAMADRPADEPPPASDPAVEDEMLRGRRRIAFDNGGVAADAGKDKVVPNEYVRASDLSEAWLKGYEQAVLAKKAANVAEKITPPRTKPTKAELDVAYNSGVSLARRGLPRRGLPGDYRGTDVWSTAMADMWEEGWDFGKANPE